MAIICFRISFCQRDQWWISRGLLVGSRLNILRFKLSISSGDTGGTYNLYKRIGVIEYASEFLLSGRAYAGIGIGIVQLSTRSLAVRTVTTQATSAGGFRNLAASVLQWNSADRYRAIQQTCVRQRVSERQDDFIRILDLSKSQWCCNAWEIETHAAVAERLILLMTALVGWKSVAEYLGQICAAIYRYRHIPRQAHFFCWQHCSVNTP